MKRGRSGLPKSFSSLCTSRVLLHGDLGRERMSRHTVSTFGVVFFLTVARVVEPMKGAARDRSVIEGDALQTRCRPGAIVIQTGTSTTVGGSVSQYGAPFSEPPIGQPTAKYVPVAGHEEALARLLYLAEHGRSGAIMVGPRGIGKSLLLAEASRELRNGQRYLVSIDLAGLDADGVYDRMLFSAGVPRQGNESHTNADEKLRNVFHGHQLVGRPVVLLLDHIEAAEAEGLKALERIVRLADRSLGQLTVLAASTDCDAACRFEWLARHSELRIDVPSLCSAEVGEYISTSLSRVYCDVEFDVSAVQRVAEVSAGLPREINRICRLIVLAAEAENIDVITRSLVDTVENELPSVRRCPPSMPART